MLQCTLGLKHKQPKTRTLLLVRGFCFVVMLAADAGDRKARLIQKLAAKAGLVPTGVGAILSEASATVGDTEPSARNDGVTTPSKKSKNDRTHRNDKRVSTDMRKLDKAHRKNDEKLPKEDDNKKLKKKKNDRDKVKEKEKKSAKQTRHVKEKKAKSRSRSKHKGDGGNHLGRHKKSKHDGHEDRGRQKHITHPRREDSVPDRESGRATKLNTSGNIVSPSASDCREQI